MTYDQHRMINIEHPATQQAESLALPRLSSQAQSCDHIQAKGCQHLAGERRCLYTNEHTPARSLMPRPIRMLQVQVLLSLGMNFVVGSLAPQQNSSRR